MDFGCNSERDKVSAAQPSPYKEAIVPDDEQIVLNHVLKQVFWQDAERFGDLFGER